MALLRPSGGRKTGTFAVLGLGLFGTTVARELMRFGNYVIGVDQDEARVSAIADELSRAVIIDVRDDEALREAGIGDCETALVAMGEDLESSIIAAINLKTMGVPRVWAKASSKTHHRILSKLKVDRIIHPEVEVGQHIAQVLHNPIVRDYVSLGNGFHVVNFKVPEKLDGVALSALKHADYDLRCVGAMRGTEFLGFDGQACTLRKDDLLILLGRRADLRSFAASLPWP
ncbi:potassium channel family protein [Mangrovicoccus algicola]|uniref:TrkA family potassium uptake protein n=1 Tax=Mangrovicoccus algicola TaxID=2771008 RepID=A0A8J6Z6Y7_9RHOB|nr:TrkA family potassium uptake protein [Mangrovicoccus algicola]MBE3639039.1 TrkA family potassium uptake protein [Mangrovicoccus algicola]